MPDPIQGLPRIGNIQVYKIAFKGNIHLTTSATKLNLSMRRTKQAIVKESESSSIDLESTNDATNAFKACIKSDVESKFYRDTPPTFFIQPVSRMVKLFTNAENYAMKSGKLSINEMTA